MELYVNIELRGDFMDLLDETITSSQTFSFLCSFYKKPKSNQEIPYEIFKMYLMNFAKEVMKNYIKDTPYSNDHCLCFGYGELESSGSFTPDINMILIKESLIRKMYEKRNFFALTVLFHELNHFKLKYDIKLGYFDENLIRVIKEELISKSSLYPSFIKVDTKDNKSTYYKDNYEFYSEEKIADLFSIENLLLFIEKANISLTAYQKEQINALTVKYARQYKNYFRDVKNNINFNSYVIDFEEAFDILIKDNPSWLEYPQLQIEYYLNKNGKVIKRNSDELKELLSIETNPSKIEYIKKLLSKKTRINYSISKKSILVQKINIKDLNNTNKL